MSERAFERLCRLASHAERQHLDVAFFSIRTVARDEFARCRGLGFRRENAHAVHALAHAMFDDGSAARWFMPLIVEASAGWWADKHIISFAAPGRKPENLLHSADRPPPTEGEREFKPRGLRLVASLSGSRWPTDRWIKCTGVTGVHPHSNS
jgi:hypothetical protein